MPGRAAPWQSAAREIFNDLLRAHTTRMRPAPRPRPDFPPLCVRKLFDFNRLPHGRGQSSGRDTKIGEKSCALHASGDSRCRKATIRPALRPLLSGFLPRPFAMRRRMRAAPPDAFLPERGPAVSARSSATFVRRRSPLRSGMPGARSEGEKTLPSRGKTRPCARVVPGRHFSPASAAAEGVATARVRRNSLI
ncbi:hypothetical protein D3C83_00550 [compost metagenome]